jgi:PKD domain/Regulator of chromosome condensation (RCC1) repeat
MKNKKYSPNLARVLVIVVLLITLTLGAISPAKASLGYTVTEWGGSNYPMPPGMNDLIAIDAGFNFSVALKSDGTVVAWGNNFYGQTNVPSGLSDVVDIAAGVDHSLALKADGTVVGWGANYFGESTPPPDLTNVVAVAANLVYSLALKGDGTVVGWGYNNAGVLEIPPDLTDVIAISAGEYHVLALKSDGTIVGWGENFHNESTSPPGLTGVVAIDAGYYYSVALKNDGTVVAWGWNEFGQTDVPAGLTDVNAISAGDGHSLALKSDGTVVARGRNYLGVLDVPSDLAGVTAISAGDIHNLALVPAVVNTPPAANPGGPYLGAVNTSIAFDGSLSSDQDGDPLTFAWDFGDGSTATEAMPTHTYTASGLYTVCLTVNDGTVSSTQACTFAVVYDPSDGFVTGGGWILSPAGAYKPNESLSGQATFGFVAKYQKGANIPSGNTAFEFDLAGMAFASQSYEWLLVNQGGTNAQFKGSGLINGAPDANGNEYKFMLWAGDGSPDTFRIRIWWEDAVGEHDVYDNGFDQAIGAGNIVVHTSK